MDVCRVCRRRWRRKCGLPFQGECDVLVACLFKQTARTSWLDKPVQALPFCASLSPMAIPLGSQQVGTALELVGILRQRALWLKCHQENKPQNVVLQKPVHHREIEALFKYNTASCKQVCVCAGEKVQALGWAWASAIRYSSGTWSNSIFCSAFNKSGKKCPCLGSQINLLPWTKGRSPCQRTDLLWPYSQTL